MIDNIIYNISEYLKKATKGEIISFLFNNGKVRKNDKMYLIKKRSS